jgi:heme-degrading monooxygenase HmoA
MHVILWEFEVDAAKAGDFVAAYSGDGAWAQLFRQATGYLGTELLCSAEEPARFITPTRYITIDRWSSSEDFTRFQRDFADRYRTLDAELQALTLSERKIGSFTSAG